MNTGANPVRFGIVGTGLISDWIMEAFAQTPSCTAAAVYSRSAESADNFAKKHGIALRFDDYDAFIRSSAIDAVYIGSPNALHYAQTMRALDAGKHVLCEKVLALNEKQAQNMQKRAKKYGLVLLEAIRPVFDPALQVIKQNLTRIGPIRRAVFEFCQYSSKYDRFKNGEYAGIFDHTLGNAALFDLGIYCVHCCLSLFGARHRRVYGASSFLSNGTEASGTVLLEYGDMQAELVYSKVTQSAFPSVIQGENGTLALDTLNQFSFVTLYHRNGGKENLPIKVLPKHLNMIFELETFAGCIRKEISAAPYMAQSIEALRIFDEIRKQTGISFGELESLEY